MRGNWWTIRHSSFSFCPFLFVEHLSFWEEHFAFLPILAIERFSFPFANCTFHIRPICVITLFVLRNIFLQKAHWREHPACKRASPPLCLGAEQSKVKN